MIINNLKELKKRKILKAGDIVIFHKFRLQYKVYDSFLDSSSGNAEIFKTLGINKMDFAGASYGYTSMGGIFPECKHGDFKALTSIVENLYRICTFKQINIGKETFTRNICVRPPIIQINDKYSATLEANYIRVGCQQIQYSVLKELYDTAKKLKRIK